MAIVLDMKKINSFMAKKFEGGLFANASITHIGDEFQIYIRYHTVLGGVIYELKGREKFRTGDELIVIDTQCVRVGDYNPKESYGVVTKEFTHKQLLGVL